MVLWEKHQFGQFRHYTKHLNLIYRNFTISEKLAKWSQAFYEISECLLGFYFVSDYTERLSHIQVQPLHWKVVRSIALVSCHCGKLVSFLSQVTVLERNAIILRRKFFLKKGSTTYIEYYLVSLIYNITKKYTYLRENVCLNWCKID